MALTSRYDFVLLFDVKDGNPNGDPDAGNLPRVDAETGHGLVTDVCIKRKIRNFVGLAKECQSPFDIYVKEKAVLGRAHTEAFSALKISLGEESRVVIPENLRDELEGFDLPDGLELGENDDDLPVIVVAADADVKTIKAAIKEAKPRKEIKDFLESCLKGVKARKPKADEINEGRKWMCQRFFDIRAFGAVMSLKSAPNCGQVRGPIQLTFARSVDPVVALEHSITRMAVATEAEAEKQSGDNRTMGRKFTVPYGLYAAHGFVSSFLAKQTGFDETDLALLWQALAQMFEHDRSAARGEMSTRGLYVFKHDSELGNAPAHQLFDLVQVAKRNPDEPARDFADYNVTVNEANLPAGVTLLRQVG
ncbi:MAG: type I-C CRISPR-associated protein Cas7/Csd2 [Gallionella sp.]|nr:type I-C CRISPR-associated protein Cas7/Csd2 [Gallionella sp.]MDD4959090.1 type I-C CRISPR-associated protein Cas7/Csd2 [Gallionella sp.]